MATNRFARSLVRAVLGVVTICGCSSASDPEPPADAACGVNCALSSAEHDDGSVDAEFVNECGEVCSFYGSRLQGTPCDAGTSCIRECLADVGRHPSGCHPKVQAWADCVRENASVACSYGLITSNASLVCAAAMESVRVCH